MAAGTRMCGRLRFGMNPAIPRERRILSQRSQTLMLPESVSISTRAPPLPWVKSSSLPGANLLVSRAFGPKQLSMSPLKDSMSKSALTGGLILTPMVPLIDSRVSRESPSSSTESSMSPETEFTSMRSAALWKPRSFTSKPGLVAVSPKPPCQVPFCLSRSSVAKYPDSERAVGSYWR